DNISGAAAVMDICASIIPLSALAGAEGAAVGMLVGSIFSFVGQILAFFAPKQPSLKDQIKEMLDHAQSEKQIQELAAVGHTINIYARVLIEKCVGGNVLAGTVTLTTGLARVTGTGSILKSLEVGQWPVFDSDALQEPYRINEIASDTSLTLNSVYSGASTTATTVKQFIHKPTKKSIDEILEMPLETE